MGCAGIGESRLSADGVDFRVTLSKQDPGDRGTDSPGGPNHDSLSVHAHPREASPRSYRAVFTHLGSPLIHTCLRIDADGLIATEHDTGVRYFYPVTQCSQCGHGAVGHTGL